MRRTPLEDAAGAVFHVSARVNWQRFLFEPDWRRDLVLRELRAACEAHGVEILAHVVMANHFHSVLRSPGPPLFSTLTSRPMPSRHRRPWPQGHQNASVLSQCMRVFMRAVSRRVQEEMDVSGRLWQESYFAKRIRDADYLVTAIAYDHLNPVRADLVERAEDYAWSSAAAWHAGGAALWDGHGYREPPFGLTRADLARDVVARETGESLRALLVELERAGVDWTMPGGFERVVEELFPPQQED